MILAQLQTYRPKRERRFAASRAGHEAAEDVGVALRGVAIWIS
jgi:hypothetical protein